MALQRKEYHQSKRNTRNGYKTGESRESILKNSAKYADENPYTNQEKIKSRQEQRNFASKRYSMQMSSQSSLKAYECEIQSLRSEVTELKDMIKALMP
jgi:predicted RNase H-like nuclease (RuvC/YqgF family)